MLIDVCIVNVNQEIHKHTETGNKISLLLLKEEKEYVLELQNISNNFCLCESFKYLYVVEYDRRKDDEKWEWEVKVEICCNVKYSTMWVMLDAIVHRIWTKYVAHSFFRDEWYFFGLFD